MSALEVFEHLSDPHSLEVLSDLALQAACEIPEEPSHGTEVALKN